MIQYNRVFYCVLDKTSDVYVQYHTLIEHIDKEKRCSFHGTMAYGKLDSVCAIHKNNQKHFTLASVQP